MRIRTQFFITMALFGLTLLVIAASVIATSREVTRLNEQEDLAADIGRGASDLGFLAGDYVLHREEQQRVRWQTKWTSVVDESSRLAPASAEERAIARSLDSDLTRLQEVFEDVVRTSDEQALVPISWSRLAVQNEGLVFDAARLSQVLRNSRAEVQERNTLLIITLVALFGAYFATNYFVTYRRGLRSLAVVQAGTEIIGRGDLDHTIPVRGNDEVGDLSRAFNKMTTDLKRVTASKSELEEEIAEREAAELALQESVIEIEELSEARLQELSTTKKLLEAADQVARLTSIEEVAEALAHILLKLTAHSRATVYSWDEQRRLITVMASEGETPFPVGSSWPIQDASAAARNAIFGRGTGVWDIDALPEDERGLVASEHALRRALYMPLVQREGVVGLIVLDNPGETRQFTEREIELVRGIAAQAAVAFENARLFQAQRNIADRLQEALLVLPEDVPGIEFAHEYHSASIATRVGGDFYDLFELSHGKVGVVIGDVAGKGLDAAVLTSMVKHTIRAHANEKGKTPRQILQLTNEVVFRATSAESFVTVFFGVLDCGNGRLVYSNAGHTSAAIVCSEGATKSLPSIGPILGAFADADFGEAETSLGLDELLFLYTDGLTEARREGGLYGEERLIDLLASTEYRNTGELVRSVIADVMVYADSHLQDDLAIMAVKRT